MQFTPAVPPQSRFSLRPFLVGAVVVLLAVVSLAFLSEAFAGDGQTVYLANIEPGGKDFPTQPSIVVTGSGGATAPAERAELQILIVRPAPFSKTFVEAEPPTSITSPPSLAPVIDVLLDAGLSEDGFRVLSSPSLISVCTSSAQCSAVRVDITIEQPSLDRLNQIVNAVGEAAGAQGLTVQDVGVGYSVADCRPLHAQARAAAAADGQARAGAQAAVLGVELGQLVVSSETAPAEPADASGCASFQGTTGDAWWTPGSVGLTVPSFDPQGVPEVAVGLQVTLAYAIGGETDATS